MKHIHTLGLAVIAALAVDAVVSENTATASTYQSDFAATPATRPDDQFAVDTVADESHDARKTNYEVADRDNSLT